MLLTFDDGLVECYDVILPILEKHSIPAVFFVNTAFIDNKDLFYRYKASLLVENISNKKLKDQQEAKLNNVASRKSYKSNDLRSFILNIAYKDRFVLDYIADILEFSFNDYLMSL